MFQKVFILNKGGTTHKGKKKSKIAELNETPSREKGGKMPEGGSLSSLLEIQPLEVKRGNA